MRLKQLIFSSLTAPHAELKSMPGRRQGGRRRRIRLFVIMVSEINEYCETSLLILVGNGGGF